jgi:hypothetical protein
MENCTLDCIVQFIKIIELCYASAENKLLWEYYLDNKTLFVIFIPDGMFKHQTLAKLTKNAICCQGKFILCLVSMATNVDQ